MKKRLLLIITLLGLQSGVIIGQNIVKAVIPDSLEGFNEQAYIDAAPFKGITPEEMNTYISISKREFIKHKYNLFPKTQITNLQGAKSTSAVCVNEDFEEGSLTSPVPGTISVTTMNAINGWTATSGNNTGSTGSCLLTGCCVSAPNAMSLIAPGVAGVIDPIIGASYPIFSVFGNTTNNGSLVAGNPSNMRGDWFVQLNNSVPGAGIHRITKTINVTPSNVIFKYASIAVSQGAHCCCDNVGLSIYFKDCLGNFLASSSQYSLAPPASTGCTPTGTCSTTPLVTFLNASTSGWFYNKWRVDSIDLSLWMGSCITVEVSAFDCPYSGHAGYAYFDAQCGPMLSTNVNALTNDSRVKLYPNPNSGTFNLDIATELSKGDLEIHNVLGQTVHKQSISKGNNSVNTNSLNKGIYTYSILDNRTLIKTGKLVIE